MAEVDGAPPDEVAAPLLEVRGLTKYYPGVRALDGVDFVGRAGRGALPGRPERCGQVDAHQVRLRDGRARPAARCCSRAQPLPVGHPAASLARGIATIYQELDLVDDLTVAENLFLGHELARCGFIDRGRHAGAGRRELLARLGPRRDPSRGRSSAALKPAQKQMVSIARALSRDVRLLIMDEPSAVLDDPEVEVLFRVVRRLTDDGVGDRLHLAPARRGGPDRRHASPCSRTAAPSPAGCRRRRPRRSWSS